MVDKINKGERRTIRLIKEVEFCGERKDNEKR